METDKQKFEKKQYKIFDQSKITGPMRKRKCTDVICFIIWVLFWGVVIAFSIYGYIKGDLNNIAQPYDSDGQPCGRSKASDYNYLYINDPFSTKYNKNMVCIKKCPKTKQDKVECLENTDIKNCNDIKIYESYGFAGRICIPKNPNLTNTVRKRVNLSWAQEVVEDIKDAWPVFIIVLLISIAICFFFYYLLQCCAGPMICIMITGSIGGLIGFGVFNWYEKIALEKESVYNEDLAYDFKVTAIVCWVVAGVLLLLVLCLISRIKLAAKMIAAAADFITDVPSTLFIPVLLSLVLAVFLVWWLVSFSFLFSVGELRYDEGDLFGDMTWSTEVQVGVWFLIFGLLWYLSFLISTNIFVTACLCASWYFQRYDGNVIGMKTAFKWAWFYHLGTLAFGSLLIALLWLVQLILSYVYQKVKDQSAVAGFCLKCGMCFVSCFERLLKYLNKHAYIEVVLRCFNFCGATRKCFEVMTTNFLRFAVLSGVVELFLIFGTILIAVVVAFIGYFLLILYGNMRNMEFETIGPITVIFLIAVLVSMFFNEIFEISSDTMLHCYVLDETAKNIQSTRNCPDKIRRIVEEMNPHKKLIDKNDIEKK